jgi:uncharacterized protein Yka (UPF0111/DUF47 family)
VRHTRPRHFYEVFADLARSASEAARILHQILAEPHPFTELLAEMTEVKRVSRARQELVEMIEGATVTPLDREDVHQVASGLGGLVSLLHDTARGVQDLGLTRSREAARALAELLVRATGCIEKSVAELRHPRVVVEIRTEMERLCEEGTAIYDRASGDLFSGAPDAMEVLRWKEVYDALEHALTQCRGVQNMLSSIALENR